MLRLIDTKHISDKTNWSIITLRNLPEGHITENMMEREHTATPNAQNPHSLDLTDPHTFSIVIKPPFSPSGLLVQDIFIAFFFAFFFVAASFYSTSTFLSLGGCRLFCHCYICTHVSRASSLRGVALNELLAFEKGKFKRCHELEIWLKRLSTWKAMSTYVLQISGRHLSEWNMISFFRTYKVQILTPEI